MSIHYASSLENHCHNDRRESRTIDKNIFVENKVTLNGCFDYVNLKNLVIHNPSSDFSMTSLKMHVNKIEVFKIDFNLWTHIDKDFMIKNNNCIVFNIPWDKFLLKDTILQPIRNNTTPIIISITYTGSFSESIIYYEQLLIDEESRRTVYKKETETSYIIQEYKYPISEETKFDFPGYCCGLYITGCNISDVTQFRFIVNNYIMIDYDKLEISLFFKKINNDCFYIPLNCNKNSDKVINDGVCFFNSHNNRIEFKGVQFTGYCHIFSKNKILYDKGTLSNLAYDF